jgi:hypothetical protein
MGACLISRLKSSAAAPMASPPRAMRMRCALGYGQRAALVAQSPRNLHLGRGVRPSLSCCVARLALRPQRAHPPSRRHAVPHGLAPVGEETALCRGHLPVVALERLAYRAAPHLDGNERGLGVACPTHEPEVGLAACVLVDEPCHAVVLSVGLVENPATVAAGRMR